MYISHAIYIDLCLYMYIFGLAIWQKFDDLASRGWAGGKLSNEGSEQVEDFRRKNKEIFELLL